MFKTFGLLIALFSIVPQLSKTQDIDYILDDVQNWADKAQFLGSPDGYRYIAQYKKVQVFSPNSDLLLTRSLKGNQKVFASPNGHYWGAATFIDRSATLLSVTDFVLYDPSGKMLYKLKDPGVLRFILNDKAADMVGIAGTEGLPLTTLKFYDESGSVKKELDITNYLGGEFCPDGNLFFALSADSGLYSFNPDGEKAFRINVGRHYAVSRDGRLVLACDRGKLLLYYNDNMTNSVHIPLSDPRAIMISDDARLALVMSRDKLICFQLPELNILWEYSSADPQYHFNSCDFHPQKRLFALGIAIDNGPDFSFSDRFNSGRVEVISYEGQKIGAAEVFYDSWSNGFPKVCFSDQGDSIWVLTHYDLFRLPLN